MGKSRRINFLQHFGGLFLFAFLFSGCARFENSIEDQSASIQSLKASDFVDTEQLSSMTENNSLFKFVSKGGNIVAETNSTLPDIHSHLINGNLFDSFNYSGKMKMSDSQSGIGITFLSQFPNRNAYYRLRRYQGVPDFHFASHGNTACEGISTGVRPVANIFYNFRISTQVLMNKTIIKAKVWEDGSAEPQDYQATCIDQSEQRFKMGTIGMWSYSKGTKYWTNLRISFDPLGGYFEPSPSEPQPSDPATPPLAETPTPSEPSTPIPAPTTPSTNDYKWTKGRNGNGKLIVDSGTNQFGTLIFEYDRSDEVVRNPPVGHGIPSGVKNRLFYNLLIDGYQGLPPGSCLKRAKYMNGSDPQKETCGRTENADLLRNWAQANGSGFENVLIKNLTVKNAIRTINVTTNGDGLPHTDTFQTYYPGNAKEVSTAQWLVIQDSEFKNSDNSIMITSHAPHRGVVYQNLKAGFCDSWFAEDGRQRNINDFKAIGRTAGSNYYYCTNPMMASLNSKGDIWLINSQSPGSVYANPQGGRLILIGSSQSLSLRSDVNIGTLCKYNTIEDALNDKTTSDGCGNFARPPFIQLSCSGWKNPPANCVNHQGSF